MFSTGSKVTRFLFFKQAKFSLNRVNDPVDPVLARALTSYEKVLHRLRTYLRGESFKARTG